MTDPRLAALPRSQAALTRAAAALAPSGPVASVYVDLDPRHFPTLASRESEVSALLDAARRGADPRELAEIAERLPPLREALLAHAGSARGLAGFADAGGAAEVVELQRSIDPGARIAALPHLLPLLAATASDRWCVALVTRRSARLLVGDGSALAPATQIADDVRRRHSRGGWAGLAQSRFARSIEHDVALHYQHTAVAIADLHRSDPFERILLAGTDHVVAPLRSALGEELRALLDGMLAIDVERATAEEVLERAQGAIRSDEERAEREVLDRLAEEGGGGRAGAGIDEVLSLLAAGRVATLLVAQGLQGAAWCCPRCDWSSGTERPCPEHDVAPRPCDAADAAIVAALRHPVPITVVRHRRDELLARGGLAALLRY